MLKLIRITTVPISLIKLLGGQLSFMNRHYDVVVVSSDDKGLKIVVDKEKVRSFCVELTRKITPFKDLFALWRLYCFLRREKPHIVHTHTPKAGTIGMVASWLARVPNRLHTVAGLPLTETRGLKRFLLNNVERITYLCATKVYPNSIGLKNFILKKSLCGKNKLKVLANGSSNGIDTNYFNPELYQNSRKDLASKLGIEDEAFVYIFIGRIVADKGVNELIKSFDMVSKCNNVKLLLVGSYEDELDPLANDTYHIINSNPKILVLGFQNDVRPFLSISDVLVFPSYREGFPNVVMQAGAMGLPSIVSNINGCNEIIIDGINGVIVEPKNIKALVLEMERLLNDKKLYQTLKSNCRKSIVDRYEQKIVWDALLQEYKSLEYV